jgi:argininosuccinate lyase
MRFAPEYVSLVLNENFEDAKLLFLDPLMAMHYAHLVMLADRGIIAPRDAATIRDALDAIDVASVKRATFDCACEDLFFHVERRLVQACGEQMAGRLHTARSRNDIDMTLYRMRQRTYLLAVVDAVLKLRLALITVAEAHVDTVLALHTHTQPAQPSTVAHYMLAMIEQLERDTGRLAAAYATTNRCPLGACAITGTGFPIDRQLTSQLLGFDSPTGNTYGSIATADFLLENVSATAVLLTGLGRFVQDMLLWSTAEFGYLRLGDGFVQGSSIMPQKRNPVALEHARAIGSKALGEATGVMVAVHNTPFGDIVDTEDDLQPLVDHVFHDTARAVTLVAAALGSATFDSACLERRAGACGVTLTELADTLVRDHGLPFDLAHAITRQVNTAQCECRGVSLADVVTKAARELAGIDVSYTDEQLAAILSPRHFVAVRTTRGGPAPVVTTKALADARVRLNADRSWLDGRRDALKAADDTRTARARSL